jgi:hypothetical protein
VPTNIPSITPLPTPVPQTSDPTNFQTRGDTFLAALPTLATEENAAIAAMNTVAGEVEDSAADALASQVAAAASANAAINATTLVRRSTTSLTIGAGTKNVTGMAAGATFANLDEVMLIDAANQNNRMWGAVSSANMGAGTMTVTVTGTNFTGSGTGLTNWIVCLSALAPTVSYAAALTARNYHIAAAAIL